MARENKIMFKNLRAEMARNGLNITIMAKELGMTRDTLSYKLD